MIAFPGIIPENDVWVLPITIPDTPGLLGTHFPIQALVGSELSNVTEQTIHGYYVE